MPPIRIDADTGEPITEFDPNEWEIAEASPTRIDAETGEPILDFNPDEWEPTSEPAGWGETLGRTALAGFYGLGKNAAGLLRQGQEALSGAEDSILMRSNPFFKMASPVNQLAPDFGAETSEMGKALIEEQRNLVNAPRGSAKELAFDIGSGAIPDVAMLAAGGLTGQPAPVIAGGMGLMSMGRKYNELRELGTSPEDASMGSTASGLIDTAANLIPVGKAVKEGAPLARRIAGTALSNAAINAPQAAADLAITDIASPADFSGEDYASAMKMGAGAGLATGIGFGTVGAITDTIRGKPSFEAPGVARAIEEESTQLALPAPEGTIYGDSFIARDPALVSPEQIDAATRFQRAAAIKEEAQIKARVESLGNEAPKQEFPNTLEVVEGRARSEADLLEASRILGEIEASKAKAANDRARREAIVKADETISSGPEKSEFVDSTQNRGSFEPPPEPPKPLVTADPRPAPTTIDTSGDVRAALKDRFGSERGHVDLLNDIATGVRHYSDLVKRRLTKDLDFKDIPSSERKLRGARGLFGKFWDNPVEYGERAGKNGVMATDAMLETPRLQAQNLYDFGESLQPFTNLVDKSRVALMAHQLRRFAAKAVDSNRSVPKFTDEQLVNISAKAPEFKGVPLSPEEIKAFRALQNTMAISLDKIGESLKNKWQNAPDTSQEQVSAAVDAYVGMLKDSYYVPFSRFGDFYVVAKDKLGNVVERQHFERRGLAQRFRDQLKNTGQFHSVEAGELPVQSRIFAQQGLHPSLDPMSDPRAFADAAKGQNTGFLRHLVRAALTEGESPDIERSVAEYLSGLSRFHAIQSQEPKVNAALRALEKENKGLSAQKLNEIWGNWKKPTHKGVATWNQLVHMWFLAGTPTSAIANASQVPVRIIPGVYREVGVGKGSQITRRATTNTTKTLFALARGKVPLSGDKELSEALSLFIRRGGTGNTVMGEFADLRRGLMRNPTAQNLMFGMFNYAEKANNIYGFLSGLDIAKAKGLKGADAYAYAEKFNGDVNIIQNDFGRPTALASPAGKVVGQYKNYQVQLLKTFFKDFAGTLKGDQRAALALAIQGASYAVLGGVSAALGASALRVLSSLGVNVPTLIEDKAGNLSNWINYGPFSQILNISPAVSTQELVPDIYNDPRLAVANTVLGAGGQFVLNQGIKAYDIATKWDNPRLAAETLAPRVLRNLSRLERWNSEGKLRDYRNQILIDRPPSIGESIQLGMGAPPLTLTKEYQKKAARRTAIDQAEAVENVNFKIAKAITEGDDEKVSRLIEKAIENGQRPDSASIRDQLIAQDSAEGAEYVARKKIPKRLRGIYDEIGDIYAED